MYLIKITAKSTEFNPNFKDVTSISYYGVNEEPIDQNEDGSPRTWQTNEYGYKTLNGLNKGINKAKNTYGYFSTHFNTWTYTISAVYLDKYGNLIEIKVE